MAEIFSTIKPLSNLTGLGKPDGSFKLYSENISSINFDGKITKTQTKTKVSELKPGQTVLVSDPSYSSSSAYITKIESRDGFIDDDPEQPVLKYYVYHVSEFSMEQPFTYNATYGDSYSANAELSVLKDDVENFVVGNDGWALTNNGNAIFSNIFARGKIEATSGKIDGILTIGEGQFGDPLVTIGSDVFNGQSFQNVSEKHSGILLDSNNYLLSHPDISTLEITEVQVENSSQNGYFYSATFTLPLESGEVNTLQVGDFVKLSGFEHANTTALNTTHQVTAVGTNTFTIAVSYNINLTSPVTINVSATSFALVKTYSLNSMTLSSVPATINSSNVKIYFDEAELYPTGSEINLVSFLGDLSLLNGRFIVTGGGEGYCSIVTTRIPAATYTSSLGYVSLLSTVKKFKVGDAFNYLSFSSETGSLQLTGTITAHSGNFINYVYVGKAATIFNVTRKKLLDNVATLRTSSAHGFSIGENVIVSGIDATFDGTHIVTGTPSEFLFTYEKIATNVTEVDLIAPGTAESTLAANGTIKVGVAETGITIDGTDDSTTSAIYAGEGEYANANTGFWMDASGRFSLKDKLVFTDTGNLTVSGTINASAGNFTNTVYIGTSVTPGTLQVGRGDNYFQITGTNVDTTTAIKTNGASFGGTGVWLDASGRFSLGDQLVFEDGNLIVSGVATDSLIVGSSPNQVIMSDTAVSGAAGIKVTSSGDYIAASGDFSLGNGGVIWDESEGELRVNGILKGYIAAELTPVTFNPGTMNFGYFSSAGTAPGGVGLKLDEFNYWFVGDKFKVGGSSNFVKWDGSDLSVVGNITATTGNIAGWQINPTRFENSGIGLVAPVIATRVNQIANPSFESSSGYWWLTIDGVNQPVTRSYDENATPVIDSSTDPDTYAGNIYLNVTAPTGVTGNAILYHTGIKDPQNAVGTGFSRPKITAGQPYTFSLYVRSPVVSRNVTLGIQWYTDTDTILSTATSTVDTTTIGSWKRFSVTGTAPTGTSSAVAFLKIDGMLAGETHRVDAAMLEKTSELRQYFDGDSDLCIWINNNQISDLKEGESRYGEVAIYTGTEYENRSGSPFYVSYNGFVNIESGNLSSFNLTSNAIIHDQSSDVFTRYIEFATDTSLATVPRISVVSYTPELNYTTSSEDVPTYSSGQIRYPIDQHTLKIGDLITISGFANTAYNISNVTIVNISDKAIFINSATDPGTATGTGTVVVLEAEKFSAQWASDHTAFYASTDGSVSIGSALSYDSEAGLSVTGEVQGYQGWIGGENGWQFDASGLLYSGSGTSLFAIPAQQTTSYSADLTKINVTRTIADDQWEEFNQLWSNYYAEVNISSLSPFYKDNVSNLRNIAFAFDFTTSTGIDVLLDNKTLTTQAVYDSRAFFYQAAVKSYIDEASYSSGSTTVQLPPYSLGGTVTIQSVGGGTPGYTNILGSVVSGTGIQSGTTVVQVDSTNSRITLSKPTTSLQASTTLTFEKVNASLKGATSLRAYAVERVSGVTKIYFDEAILSSTTLNAVDAKYRLSSTDSQTNSIKITALGSTTQVNALNDQTVTISAIGSAWEYINGEYLWSLSFNQPGQPNIALTYAQKSIIDIHIPLPTDTYTLVFYPETAGVYIHENPTSLEAGRTYTTGQHTLGFYDISVSSTDSYYLWGGGTNPSTAPLSISKKLQSTHPDFNKNIIKADIIRGTGTTPVGSIVMWSEAALPSGWILCNGQSTTAYPLLNAVVGATVPDLRDRFIVGAGSAYGLKSAAGAANHNHGNHKHANTATSESNGGSHNHEHTISINAHNHSDTIGTTEGGAVETYTTGNQFAYNVGGTTGGANAGTAHTHSVSRDYSPHNHVVNINGGVSTNNAANQGGNISGGITNDADHAHTITTTVTNVDAQPTDASNLPPYYALYFIIYTGKVT